MYFNAIASELVVNEIQYITQPKYHYSRGISIIRTVRLTVLLEYFDSKCMFYQSNVCSIRVFDHNFVYK